MAIMKLTAKQEAELPAFRRRYLDMACDGRRANRDRLHAALAEAYAEIGKPRPLLLIVNSPIAGMRALAALRGLKGWKLRAKLVDQLGAQLGDELFDQLRAQLRAKRLWDPSFLWGSQELYWIAWALFARKIGVKLAPETDRRLVIMDRIASECEWWWPYEKLVVASERPTEVRFDDARRLHREDGPAVLYADGYALWSWHGVRVPEKWITEKAITAQDALTWPNMEQRRAACEILGWNTILNRLEARTIDRDEDPEIGELVEVTIPDIGREKFLRVTCGTGRQFALPVPPDMKTALQANAWTYGLNADAYCPEVRT